MERKPLPGPPLIKGGSLTATSIEVNVKFNLRGSDNA